MTSTAGELEAIWDELDDQGAEPCLFCGQPEHAGLHEVWGPREFMVDTCCEGMHQAVVEFLNED